MNKKLATSNQAVPFSTKTKRLVLATTVGLMLAGTYFSLTSVYAQSSGYSTNSVVEDSSGASPLDIASSEVKADEVGSTNVMNTLGLIHARNITIYDKQGNPHEIDGSGTAIGVVGDGIEPDHPGFKNQPKNPKIKRSGNSKVIIGNHSAEIDEHDEAAGKSYHDLFTAGVAAANGMTSNDEDARPIEGVSPESQIVFERISGEEAEIDEAEALQDAVNIGADVINLSFGVNSSTMNLSKSFMNAIEDAQANGVVVVSSMGNSGYVGYEGTKPQSTNPDYGVVSRPGLVPAGIGSSSCNNAVIYSQGFRLAGSSVDTEYWTPLYWSDGFKSYDNKDYQYVILDHPTALDFMGENANKIKDKFVVLPAVVEGLSNSENNPNGKWPDHIILSHLAKEAGAAGTIFYDNTKPYRLDKPFWPILWKHHVNFFTQEVEYDWDEFETFKNYPVLGISNNSLIRMRNAADKTLHFSAFERDNIRYERGMKMAGDTSWGVSSDFVFKSDITAPAGKSLTSLTNKFNKKLKKRVLSVGQNSGTSFSAPQIAAGIAMVKQRLNIQHPELVAKNAKTAYLLKNLLMSTCKPLSDTNSSGQEVMRSPRVQGNGLMQIREACQTDCIAVSPRTSDTESGYAKTNLRSFDGRKIEFDIEVQNIGNKERKYQPYLNVITDDVQNGYYTLQSNYLAQHIKLQEVSVPARDGNSTEYGKTTLHVSYEIPEDVYNQLQKASPNGFFVEGFVTFEPLDADNKVSLTHSFTGFAGDWFKPPVYDPFVYDLKDGQKNFYHNFTKDMMDVNQRSGDMNSTHLETQVDRDRLMLGAKPDYTSDNMSVSDKLLAISPNADGRAEFIDPVFTMLRNYKDIQIKVDNSEGEEVFHGSYGLGVGDLHKSAYGNETEKADALVTSNLEQLRWDAKDVSTGKVLPEGEYTYHVNVIPDFVDFNNQASIDNLTKGDPAKAEKPITRDFKVKVDVTAPVLHETEVVREEANPDDANDPLLHLKLYVEDPQLHDNKTSGSGIFAAEMITGEKTTPLTVDPLDPKSIENQDIVVKKSEFKHMKLKLTDTARNSSVVMPALKLKGMKYGHLDIESKTDTGDKISARYLLENLQTGDMYTSYDEIPVGYYTIHPYNAPEGYTLQASEKDSETAKASDTFVEIKEGKTEKRLFTYEHVNSVADFEAGPLTDNAKDKVLGKSVQLMLTNKKTGMSYVMNADSEGYYSTKLVKGTYSKRFIGADESDGFKVWNDRNVSLKNLSLINDSALFYYRYGLSNEKPEDEVILDSHIDTYLAHQTFMHITAPQGATIELALFPADKTGQSFDKNQATKVLSQANGDFTAYPLDAAEDGADVDYYLDFTDKTVDELAKPWFIRVFATIPHADSDTVEHTGGTTSNSDKRSKRSADEDTKVVAGSKMAMVGFNHTLVLQQRAYLLKEAQKMADSGTLSAEDLQKVKDLGDEVAKLKNYLNLNRDSYIDLSIDPDDGNLAKPSANEIASKQTNHLHLFEIGDKLNDMAALLGKKVSDIPTVSAHLGYFPEVRTMIYPRVRDQYYSFVEVPTTTFVPYADTIKDARDVELGNIFYYDEDGQQQPISVDQNGKTLAPKTTLALAPLDKLASKYYGAGWKKVSGADIASVLVNPLAGTTQVKPGLTSFASVQPTLKATQRLSVIALDSANKKTPVVHAGIKLVAQNGSEVQALTSDGDGQIDFTRIPAGIYTLVSTDDQPAGYAKQQFTHTLVMAEDGSFTVDGKAYTIGEPLAIYYDKLTATTTDDGNKSGDGTSETTTPGSESSGEPTTQPSDDTDSSSGTVASQAKDKSISQTKADKKVARKSAHVVPNTGEEKNFVKALFVGSLAALVGSLLVKKNLKHNENK